MVLKAMRAYGELCGWTLARAHARTGDRTAIAAYLGSGPEFDEAIRDFAAIYADRNEREHRSLVDAVASGRISAASGL
jgi:NAD(P)H-dependent flavin oxidoreductase YrpB (nitropropane dioxygenase family)